MSFDGLNREALSAAAAKLASVGSAVAAREAATAGPTIGLVPAGADDVSALMATQFAAQAEMYQAVSAQARAMHEMFVNILATAAGPSAATPQG